MKVIRVTLWGKDGTLQNVYERGFFTKPCKVPAWQRTLMSLLRFAAKSAYTDFPNEVARIGIEFKDE